MDQSFPPTTFEAPYLNSQVVRESRKTCTQKAAGQCCSTCKQRVVEGVAPGTSRSCLREPWESTPTKTPAPIGRVVQIWKAFGILGAGLCPSAGIADPCQTFRIPGGCALKVKEWP